MMSRAVREGREHFDEKLASLNPGTVHNASWLTKANRILRLYVSTLHPSVELIRVISIIINIYAPSWFYFKSHPYCYHGSSSLFYSIQLIMTI